VGLRRRGFTNEQVDTIHQAYRYIYQSGLNTSMAIERIKAEMEMTPEIEYIVSFVEGAKRGIIK
jgi:UDP-N-acetylglucosamine acyltransferase